MKKFTLIIIFAFIANLIIGSAAFGQIAQRGSSTNGSSTNTSLQINKPTGVVSGDIMIVNIAERNTTGDPSLSGWTYIASGAIDGANTRGALLYKVAGGSEPANYTFTLGSGANNNEGTIVAFSGVDVTGGFLVGGGAGGPFDVAPGNILSVSGSNGTTATASGITTTSANAAVIMFAESNDNQSMGSWSTTSPGTLTELYENQYNPSGANDLTLGAAWAIKATAGATGNGTVTLGASIRWGAKLIALKAGVVVVVPANLWACSSSGTQIADYSVSNGSVISGPTNRFAPTFPGGSTGGTSTAALGRSNVPSPSNGYFYWLPNTSGNSGVVEVFGSDANGGSQSLIGSLDVNGASGNSLGFVRLGMGPDGRGWILAGDGTTLYLAKFTPNGVNPVAITLEDADGVSLSGGSVSTFSNGDLCLNGNGTIFALANNGSGVTQIFIGSPAGNSTTLTKKWDLVDGSNNPFTGSVNGVAFDIQGSLYISTAVGLYYINAATVNGPAGTVQCTLVQAQTGLQDLASNVFPANSPLPVTFIDFSVIKSGSSALLKWSTATEVNNDHFDIQRSVDGINFTSIGSVSGNGTTSSVSNYQFIDPLSSVTDKMLYYRIVQVDVNSKSSNSKIVALKLNGGIIKDMTVFPNPFTSDLRVQITSNKETVATIRINNVSGQQVVNRKVNLQPGENIVVLQNLEALMPGLHLMEIITEDGKITQKIMKK